MKRNKLLPIFSLIILLILSLLGCIRSPMQVQTSPVPTQESFALDLWTAPPENSFNVPADVPTDTPSPSSAAESTVAPTGIPAETPAPTATPSPTPTPLPTATPTPRVTDPPVSEDGIYDSKDDVALYLHLYGHLPSNYITKKDAQALGWPGGNLEPYAPGKCIGGDRFGNYEQLLPVQKGRTYFECDIDTLGARSRGAKRIIWSNDGLIYYTDDHYESFTLLYGGN